MKNFFRCGNRHKTVSHRGCNMTICCTRWRWHRNEHEDHSHEAVGEVIVWPNLNDQKAQQRFQDLLDVADEVAGV